jgi:hypothetical protein
MNSKGKSRAQATDFRSPTCGELGRKARGLSELATPIGGWKFDEVLVLFFEARGHYYCFQSNYCRLKMTR